MKITTPLLAPLIERYFTVRLMQQRKASSHTTRRTGIRSGCCLDLHKPSSIQPLRPWFSATGMPHLSAPFF